MFKNRGEDILCPYYFSSKVLPLKTGIYLRNILTILSYIFLYGWYLIGISIQLYFLKILFSWVNVWKLFFPWYAPMPLFPTPPNPICDVARCNTVSLIQPPPNASFSVNSFCTFLSLEKIYNANGCGRFSIKYTASSN